MEHPYEIKCYMVPDSIIKLGAKLLLACYSAKFIDSISEASITHKKGWYQFKYFRNGLPLTQSISEDGSMYRNTPKYYHKNRLTKLKKPLQGFIKDVRITNNIYLPSRYYRANSRSNILYIWRAERDSQSRECTNANPSNIRWYGHIYSHCMYPSHFL